MASNEKVSKLSLKRRQIWGHEGWEEPKGRRSLTMCLNINTMRNLNSIQYKANCQQADFLRHEFGAKWRLPALLRKFLQLY